MIQSCHPMKASLFLKVGPTELAGWNSLVILKRQSVEVDSSAKNEKQDKVSLTTSRMAKYHPFFTPDSPE